MGRPLTKHIDQRELNALVPSSAGEGRRLYGPLSNSTGEVERHVASCAECKAKVAQYRQLIERTNLDACETLPPQPGCPIDIDWHELETGLWPQLRTQQLITHAAKCSHCGPLLRAATSSDEPTPEEEAFLAQLETPTPPAVQPARSVLATQHPSIWRQLWNWKVLAPVGALLVLIAILTAGRSSRQLSGSDLVQFAASTHQQYFQGKMALDLQSDSQTVLNQWLRAKSEFPLALPVSSDLPREGLPYRLEGARIVRVHGRTAAYIAYRTGAIPASLLVTPVSSAVATGGVEAPFNKVTFHYYTIQGYKVVAWSVHGLTYALVTEEGNGTQRSCMVCHSPMRDRDLSGVPTPLADHKNLSDSIWQ